MKIRMDDMLEVAYSKGMQAGYEKGMFESPNHEKSYNEGLKDAWDCARKIIHQYSISKSYDVLNFFNINNPQKAIDEFKKFESKPTKEDTMLKAGLKASLKALPMLGIVLMK